MNDHFSTWRQKSAKTLRQLKAGCHPKEVITALSEDLLAHYTGKPLIDKYDVYQHLMDYWAETMQDNCYAIAADGWKAETYRIIEKDKKGKEKDKGSVPDRRTGASCHHRNPERHGRGNRCGGRQADQSPPAQTRHDAGASHWTNAPSMKHITFTKKKFPKSRNGTFKLPFTEKALLRAVVAAGQRPTSKLKSIAAQADIDTRQS
jgi:hypothetical protein